MSSELLPYEEKAQKLTTELRRIFHDERVPILFVLSAVVDYEEDVDELLYFIKHDDEIDEEAITACALEIQDRRGEE
ncbi:hypothetical protein NXH64_01125 [Butyrivibrio fibrisolvens]|uniref:hypothetical protein n=1 Tax=Pseudobutyrivibrio ruminis TaxID=46206 RepID=UPI0003F53A53|nr:hypothetical protein [Pseudobutyrivibrio ruminis]MDC7278093.1 hypothetical protein [Butyrivibrio fibrisolvens]